MPSSPSPTNVLTGEFVDLRPLTADDAELTFHWRRSDRAVLLNRGAGSLEQQAAWIASRPADEYNFVLELKDGRPVGMLSLVGIDTVSSRAEPGRFLIGDEEAVRGVPAAVEAMLLLYQLAFDQLRLHRLHGTIAEENTRMIKWQTFLGMTIEGRLRDHYFINGRFQDAVCLGLLEGEYRQKTLPRLRSLIAAGRQRVAPQPISE